MPWRLASVLRRVGLLRSKNANTVEQINCCFASDKAWSWSGSHTYSFFVLNKARSGASRFAILSVLVVNWFTRPKNERNSVRVAGVGNSEIAFVNPVAFLRQFKCHTRLAQLPLLSVK